MILLWLACRTVDGDGDGWRSGEDCDEAALSCEAPAGHVGVSGDCDDSDATIHPDAEESCNGKDDDCDGEVDEETADATDWYADADGDGFGAGDPTEACFAPDDHVADDTDCDDTEETVYPGAEELPYDGIDQDCDGEDLLDLDDCDDGIDNDCDEEIDTDCQYFGGVVSGEPAAVISARTHPSPAAAPTPGTSCTAARTSTRTASPTSCCGARAAGRRSSSSMVRFLEVATRARPGRPSTCKRQSGT